MKVIYIAGPYRGDVAENMKKAHAVGDKLASAGVAFICPHSNGNPHDHLGQSDEYWLESTLEIMRRCDGVQLVEGWDASPGTNREIIEALNLNMPVFYPEQIDNCIRWALEV